MATGIITAICSILALALGIWKWIRRVKKHERTMVDEAKKKYDSSPKSESDILDAFGRINRANRL